MTEQKAKALAAAIGGDVVRTRPQSRMWGVSLVRADGRYALLEEHAGAVYFDEHACWTGYMVNGSDPKGEINAEEWGIWDHTRQWATGLATLIGGQPHQSGGNIWVMLFERRDGRFVVIGDLGAEVYRDRGSYEAGQEEPERFDWE